jgi:uncharacterized protein (DUF305 family)
MLKQGSFWTGALAGIVVTLVAGFLFMGSMHGRGGMGDRDGMHHDADDMGEGMGMGMGGDMGLYGGVNETMHSAMAFTPTGDADVDFMRGMLPHHQGAVGMARIVMEHGDDPQVRALADAIIAAQEREIAEIEAWLAQHAPE